MARLIPVASLLISFGILCLGHGLQSVLLPARGAMFEHYPNLITGAMMSAYYAGFITGTFFVPVLLHGSAIFEFCCLHCLHIGDYAFHALVPTPILWIAIRVIYGFCMVQLYTIMESWLNSIGDAQSRGKILSVYMITNFITMSAGQSLFFVATVEGFELFCISAMMLSLAVLPLTLSRITQPLAIQPVESFGVKQLMHVSPLGVAGALTAGLMGGAYWGLTAIFVLRMGFTQDAVAWFMSASLIGGLIAQWPLGALSDRINRRYVILLASLLIVLASIILSIMANWPGDHSHSDIEWLVAIGILFGAGFHPLYSLCIAHTNDFVGTEHFVRASAGLQLVQGIGAVIGPLLAGILMYVGGSAMLFIYIGGLAVAFAAYTFCRLMSNRTPANHRPFRMLTRTGLFAFFLDPRYRDQSEKP